MTEQTASATARRNAPFTQKGNQISMLRKAMNRFCLMSTCRFVIRKMRQLQIVGETKVRFQVAGALISHRRESRRVKTSWRKDSHRQVSLMLESDDYQAAFFALFRKIVNLEIWQWVCFKPSFLVENLHFQFCIRYLWNYNDASCSSKIRSNNVNCQIFSFKSNFNIWNQNLKITWSHLCKINFKLLLVRDEIIKYISMSSYLHRVFRLCRCLHTRVR